MRRIITKASDTIKVNREQLLWALTHMSKITQVLHLCADNGHLAVRGTVDGISMQLVVPAVTTRPYTVILEGTAGIVQWLKQLKRSNVEITKETITDGATIFLLQHILEEEEYPEAVQTSCHDIRPIYIRALDIVNALTKTIYAVSHQKVSSALTGIYLCAEDHILNFVASDGKRLVKHSCFYRAPDLAGAIIPINACKLLIGVLQEFHADVLLFVDSKSLYLTCGPLTINIRTLDTAYPNYTRIIPTVEKNGVPYLTCKVKRIQLKSSLQLLLSMVNVEDPAVLFKFDKEGHLTVSYTTGGRVVSSAASTYIASAPEDMEVRLNIHTLIKFLDTVDTDMINTTLWNNMDTPVIFESMGTSCMLMPMLKEG